ncbi:hypothetical protein KBY28_21050 [Ruegeria pomeroyi]|nr:hypothetical protein [Ruegeria pomeroyi]
MTIGSCAIATSEMAMHIATLARVFFILGSVLVVACDQPKFPIAKQPILSEWWHFDVE